ncbi:MAG: hypothetical protein RAO92_08530 [Candidatus Euphemobacter frigidus]|nr:hypothetical protein [Candidatus Euphemobacter frigidus]MDP8276433.1 hypothetical protein [Candidatus Euphemobacter frigidus]
MRNWEIRARSRFCSSCDQPFEIGQTYLSILDFRELEPQRKDYCVRCWKERGLAASPFDFAQDLRKEGAGKAYWQSHFKRLTTPAEKEVIKKDVIERLLDRYIRSEEESHINLCYILALLEERKKVLIPRETMIDEEGRKIIVYEHAATGATYLIRDPQLSLTEVETVQKQVKELIEQEKEPASSSDREGNEETAAK